MSDFLTSFTSRGINPECLQLVATEYSKLDSAIDDLNTTIGNKLDRQRWDIEIAHKAEIEKLKEEIQVLMNEKQSLEEAIISDERSHQLQTERDWYKKEAINQDELLKQVKARQEELIDQQLQSEQDAKLMNRQVNKLIKRNRTLELKLKDMGVTVNTLIEDGIYVVADMEDAHLANPSEGIHTE